MFHFFCVCGIYPNQVYMNSLRNIPKRYIIIFMHIIYRRRILISKRKWCAHLYTWNTHSHNKRQKRKFFLNFLRRIFHVLFCRDDGDGEGLLSCYCHKVYIFCGTFSVFFCVKEWPNMSVEFLLIVSLDVQHLMFKILLQKK